MREYRRHLEGSVYIPLMLSQGVYTTRFRGGLTDARLADVLSVLAAVDSASVSLAIGPSAGAALREQGRSGHWNVPPVAGHLPVRSHAVEKSLRHVATMEVARQCRVGRDRAQWDRK